MRRGEYDTILKARRGEIVQLHRQGLSERQIGKRLGVTKEAIKYQLRAAGIVVSERDINGNPL